MRYTAPMKKLLLAVTAITVLTGCRPAKSELMKGSTSGNRPQQIFEGVVFASMPADVVDLQIGAHSWQGYSFAMRFRANSETIMKILNQGYTQEACLASNFENKEFTFEPPWEPPMKLCYVWNDAVNAWTYNATHRMSVDLEKSEVHMVGVGA
jgi:hypothetical protein